MKIIRIGLVFFFLWACSATGVYADKNLKVGYVDLSRLFDDYYVTKDYDKVLEGQTKKFEEERNAKIEKIRESQGKLGLLKDEEKAKLEEEIEQMKADLLEYDRQKKTDLTKERNEKIREILLEIEKVVSDYADKENYSIILNDRVLIYGNQTFDLTEQILAILNEGQSKK